MRSVFLKRSCRPRQNARGVTLIELMVALVIGSLLIAGAITVYMQSRNTYRTSDTWSRLQETGRYVFSLLEPDVRGAGFWGMTNRGDEINDPPTVAAAAVAAGVANTCAANWILDFTRFLDGRDNGAYGLACPATTQAAQSDVLIVRRAAVPQVARTANRVQIQTNRISGTIFSDGAMPAGFAAAPASETHNLVVNAYYVSDMGIDAGGLRQFQLRRQHLSGSPDLDCASAALAPPCIVDQIVIPGVQDLQVQFGIDANGDGNADRYINPPVAGQRVVSARIWILLVSDQRELDFVDNRTYTLANIVRGPFNDNRRRLLMSKTIQIRNSQP